MAHLYVFGLIFLFLGEIYCSFPFPGHNQPMALTQYGWVKGLYKKSFRGYTYRSFEGIPYALPFVPENRFKDSVLYNKRYIGTLNATVRSDSCLYINHFHKEHGEYAVKGNEDCLYLNIYIRDEDYYTEKPVIINFNPGGFGQTGSEGISPEYLMDRDDVLLVTFNYRLGPLGFLSTGDAVVPGNMGLKDQVVAMRWVKENIKSFGGDANKITLMGLSAGGASVHYHMISPLTKGLFHRAFSFSGSALCPWSLILDVPQQTKKLASLLGCPTESSSIIVKCLRERPGNVIVEQMKQFQVWLYNPFTIFGPVIEKAKSANTFLSMHPVDAMISGPAGALRDVPWIVSVDEDEGLYPGAEFVYNSDLLAHLEKNWNTIAPHLLFFNHSTPQSSHNMLSNAVKQLYLNNLPIAINTRKELLQMLSDRLFIAPSVNSAILAAQRNKEPVYFYKYNHKNSVSLSQMLSGTTTVIGSSHGDDFSLILKLADIETKVTKEDKEMSELLMNILVTFASTGDVPKELKWQRLPKIASGFSYLNIRSSTDIKMVPDCNLGHKKNISHIFYDDKSALVGNFEHFKEVFIFFQKYPD